MESSRRKPPAEAHSATGSGPDPSALMTFGEITDAVGLPDHRRLDERYSG
ncbi:MAG: hypothetical protein ACPGRF_01830 [Miltoncostaeaceae bacterium]